MGPDRVPLFAQSQPGEAKHDRLPQPSRRRTVDAMVGVAPHVLQVCPGGVHKVLEGRVRIPQPRGQEGLDRCPSDEP
jgi:hypothetical protein